MDLNEFMERAMATDQIDGQEEAIRIGLFGIAGEAGSVVSEAKKWLRDGKLSSGLESNIREELGDLLWYVALLAKRLGMDLNSIAEANLQKTHELWSSDLSVLPAYDNHDCPNQKFLRQMVVRFEENCSDQMPIVKMIPEGELAERFQQERLRKNDCSQLGDDLNDNAAIDDGYRYHDIIHLAHATVLGWSPVLRALMGAQRRNVGDKDRVEDGARAKAIEEGLAAFVFNYLEPLDFSSEHLDWNLFKHVRRTVRGLEVSNQSVAAWRSAYEQAFEIFVKLREHQGGLVMCDLDERKLIFVNGIKAGE